jgi:nitroreductase
MALADLYRRSWEPYIAARTAERVAAGGTDATIERVTDSAAYLAEHLHEVPVHVIPCQLDRLPAGAGVEMSAGYYGSILPAVWSLMLALRSRGLGSAWTTLHLVYEREAGEILGIPDTVTQVALIPVAYYTGEDFQPGSRRPADEITYWNAWRQRA